MTAVATTLLVLGVIVPVNSVAAQTVPEAPEPACSGETAAVLVDASSEPDLYAAFLLAGVLDTGCLVDAGDRNGELPAESQSLLETESLNDGYAVGGAAAVPAAKLVGGLSWRRAGGADRWATLRIIGGAAANPQSLPAAGDDATAPSSSGGSPSANCDGETAAVLVDASSEPDLYAAFLLAGVLDTGCLVDAGDRNGELPAESQSLLETESLNDGYAVGGAAAVPAAKLVGGLSWRRAGGADRWATLRIIGGAAANPQSLPATDAAPAAQPTDVAAETTNGFAAISAGTWHSCGLRSSGEAICWGNNAFGQASPPSGEFTAIAAGGPHSCGLRSSGEAVCWGISDGSDNDYGQVSDTPSGTFTAIAASPFHSCGLRHSGEAVCWGGWGNNAFGQASPPSGEFTAIAAGGPHSCGLRSSGEAVCWGISDGSDNDYGQVSDTPSGTFTAIAASPFHSCGLRHSGEAVCWGGWGNNAFGQASPPSGEFTAISAGNLHSCGLRSSGEAVCWGISDGSDNDLGQVSDTPSGTFTAVSVSSWHSCGLRRSGEAVCWGNNASGQAWPPFTYTAVSAGGDTSCALRHSGEAVCWGGRGSNEFRQASPPSGEFTAVSVSFWHSCGLRPSGEAVCWGISDNSDNDHGQVSDTPSGTFTAISAGDWHSCGLRPSGEAVCWGADFRGQATPSSGEFTAISAGSWHSCGLRPSGEAVCWGISDNSNIDYGQVSDTPSGTFTAISATAARYSCGLRPSGEAVCWGIKDGSDQDFGQVSDTPSGTFAAISAGHMHGCGLRPSGEAVCWGISDSDHPWDDGQVSDTPSGTFTAISAGHMHSCGRRPWGATVCWGADSVGQASPPR